MTEPLQNPPLASAFCRFFFESAGEWDWTIPGELYRDIREEYPEKEQLFGYEVEVEEAGSVGPSSVSRIPRSVQLSSQEHARSVEVGPQLLEIQQGRPYPGWEDFLDQIVYVFERYRDVGKAPVLQGISLRYVNRLEKEGDSEDLTETLTVLPDRPGRLGGPLTEFYQEYSIEYEQPEGVLIHRSGTASVEERDVVMLDIEFRIEQLSEEDLVDEISRRLGQAHECIYEAFEDSLQPEYFEQLK